MRWELCLNPQLPSHPQKRWGLRFLEEPLEGAALPLVVGLLQAYEAPSPYFPAAGCFSARRGPGRAGGTVLGASVHVEGGLKQSALCCPGLMRSFFSPCVHMWASWDKVDWPHQSWTS